MSSGTLVIGARPGARREVRADAREEALWREHGWALGLGPTVVIVLAVLAAPALQAVAHALWTMRPLAF